MSNGLAAYRDGKWQFVTGSYLAVWTRTGMPLFVASPVGVERWSSLPNGRMTGVARLRNDQSRLGRPAAIWAGRTDEAWAVAKLLDGAGKGRAASENTRVLRARFVGTSGVLDVVPAPYCNYRGIHGTGNANVWIVGDRGCILHFDGVEWSRTTSGVQDDLYAVAACAPNEAWAVGEGGTILQWDGQTWRSRNSGTTNDLLGIAGCTPSDVWVVGEAGTALRHPGRPRPPNPDPG